MSDIVLHHYAASPFAQKVRAALGLKRLPWRSVEVPMVMPKPLLTPLTAGFRRVPVMQIGADVYCDSKRILDELERRHPSPSLFPDGHAGLARALAHWADTRLFLLATTAVFGAVGNRLPPGFVEDRERLTGRKWDLERMAGAAPGAVQQLRAHLVWLDQQLGRPPFLAGGQAGLADLAVYHPLWFVRGQLGEGSPVLAGFANLQAWLGRMDGLGIGEPGVLAAEEALAVAKASTPQPQDDDVHVGPFAAGARVAVTAEDSREDPAVGRLHVLTDSEIVLLHDAPEVGEVAVHLPVAGYRLRPAAA